MGKETKTLVQENEPNRTMRIARILHVAMIIALIVYVFILFYVNSMDIRIFNHDDPELQLIEVILGIITVILIVIGYFMPKVLLKFLASNTAGILSFHIIRLSFFESIGIYGLILGVIGAEWYVSLLFFLVCAAALVFSFPTKTRWRKMLAKYEGNNTTGKNLSFI